MEDVKNMSIATKAIHGGVSKEKGYGSLSMPIYQTSTFVFETAEQGGRRFAGEEEGYIYSRLGNPTISLLEEKIALLEGAEACVAFSSGMGAISSTLWTIAAAGKHIIADSTLYGCTFALLNHGMTRYGVEVSFIDTSDLDQVKNALKDNTCAVYLESPANPTLKIEDIAEVAKIAHDFNKDIKVVVDNTFATPVLQKPLELGADVVVHSATKYLNGHGDVIAGFACGTAEFMAEMRLFGLKDMTGAVLGPQEAFLIMRGLKTLALRVPKHVENAKKIVEYLVSETKVKKVDYPGLEDHPGHDIAAKQMADFGGMVAFEVESREAGAALCNALELCTCAVSLGDAETLIEHPASMTHSPYTAEELAEAGIPEGLIRLAVGLEEADELIADFKQAFAKI
ncbi:MAG: methionine gamma-lyase [Firmicutes bacterium]|nr:methionine gamma-lyase [Bacillota bacterium]